MRGELVERPADAGAGLRVLDGSGDANALADADSDANADADANDHADANQYADTDSNAVKILEKGGDTIMCQRANKGIIECRRVYETLPDSLFTVTEITIGPGATDPPTVVYALTMTQKEWLALVDAMPFLAKMRISPTP